MLTRSQKEELAEELTQKIADSKAVVICDYKGLKVDELKSVREALRENGGEMLITKKTLIQIALEQAKIDLDVRKMEGQIAIVHGGDEISSPKALYEFSKDNDNLKILAGALEKKAISDIEVINLAKLPSKDELLARVVGSIKAPMNGFVQVLSGNLKKFVYALNAIKESKDNA